MDFSRTNRYTMSVPDNSKCAESIALKLLLYSNDSFARIFLSKSSTQKNLGAFQYAIEFLDGVFYINIVDNIAKPVCFFPNTNYLMNVRNFMLFVMKSQCDCFCLLTDKFFFRRKSELI